MPPNQEPLDTKDVPFTVHEYNQIRENSFRIKILERAMATIYAGLGLGAAWLLGWVVLHVLEK